MATAKKTPGSGKKTRQQKRVRPAVETPWYQPFLDFIQQIGSWVLAPLRRFLWAHRKVGSGLYAILMAAPPFMVQQFYGSSDLSGWVDKQFPSVGGWLHQGVVVILLVSLLWGPLMAQVKNQCIRWFDANPPGWTDAAASMLVALNSVVGKKARQIGEALQKATDPCRPPMAPSDALATIADPVRQIHAITSAIYSVAQILTSGARQSTRGMRVSVAFTDGKIVEIITYLPDEYPPKTSPEALADPKSGIMTAHTSQRLHVVESVRTASRRGGFVSSRPDHDGGGSMLCFPINVLNGDSLVVSIFHPENRAFMLRYKEQYKELLEPFAIRMRMEYQLLLLKGALYNGQVEQS